MVDYEPKSFHAVDWHCNTIPILSQVLFQMRPSSDGIGEVEGRRLDNAKKNRNQDIVACMFVEKKWPWAGFTAVLSDYQNIILTDRWGVFRKRRSNTILFFATCNSWGKPVNEGWQIITKCQNNVRSLAVIHFRIVTTTLQLCDCYNNVVFQLINIECTCRANTTVQITLMQSSQRLGWNIVILCTHLACAI